MKNHLKTLESSDPDPDLHQNFISSSLSNTEPVHKISSGSVHNFLRYHVHRQTNKQAGRRRWPDPTTLYFNPGIVEISKSISSLNIDRIESNFFLHNVYVTMIFKMLDTIFDFRKNKFFMIFQSFKIAPPAPLGGGSGPICNAHN